MDVDIALLGKSVVLPNTALPADTRITIEGIGRGNYVGFVHNTFRPNHHLITFDLIRSTVRFTRSHKKVHWDSFVVSDADRSVSVFMMTGDRLNIPIFAGMLVFHFLSAIERSVGVLGDRVLLVSQVSNEKIEIQDVSALLSSIGIHEALSGVIVTLVDPEGDMYHSEGWRAKYVAERPEREEREFHTIQCVEKQTGKKWGDPALTSLTRLGLAGNQIADIAPLAALTSLTHLYLHNNQIADIAPLAALTSLTHLYLHNNQITDIAPLSALTSLTDLYLGDNQITDLAPLSALTSLTELRLGFNKITDIKPLSAMTSLEGLDLRWTDITDITPLSALTSLTTLDLRISLANQRLYFGRLTTKTAETLRLLRSRGCRVDV
eukprot:SAG22_NODE_937_length_6418_cov_124.858680_5_plen_379_part_00